MKVRWYDFSFYWFIMKATIGNDIDDKSPKRNDDEDINNGDDMSLSLS